MSIDDRKKDMQFQKILSCVMSAALANECWWKPHSQIEMWTQSEETWFEEHWFGNKLQQT